MFWLMIENISSYGNVKQDLEIFVEHNLKNVKSHFEFGKNWSNYSSLINTKRIEVAEKSLIKLIGKENILGKTFIDIGCGSGLFSLAALKLGALKVLSLDIDSDSVETTKKTIEKYATSEEKARFSCHVCSVFELSQYIPDHETYDIVFSWGVLHHTGDMNEAILCASKVVSDEGILVISLYYKTRMCAIWNTIKKFYTNSGAFVRSMMNWTYIFSFLLAKTLIKFENPFKFIKNYHQNRGMSYFYDVIDWLGGYPYESITTEELSNLLSLNHFKILKDFSQKQTSLPLGFFGSGCSEYVAIKKKPSQGIED